MSKEEEIDPSIYQYDEVYDEIKGKKEGSRSRSRDKEKAKVSPSKPKKSKYINKMKQLVSERQKGHELAH